MSEEKKHILDTIITNVKDKLNNDKIKVYLAVNGEEQELLAIKTEGFEKGLDLGQIVSSYGIYRIYQCETEEEAIDSLCENLANSITAMITEAAK
jgi:hypothetical protein